jgi:hypothetical protein
LILIIKEMAGFIFIFYRPNYILQSCRYIGFGKFCKDCQDRLDEGDKTIASAIQLPPDESFHTNIPFLFID